MTDFHFDHNRVIITPERFDALRIVPASPNFCGMAYQQYRALITRRSPYSTRPRKCWHIVERQFQFGQPVVFAREIVIRLPSMHQAGDAAAIARASV